MLHHHQVRRSSSFLGSRQWIRVGLPRLESCVSLCGWDDPLVCNEWIPVESDVRDLISILLWNIFIHGSGWGILVKDLLICVLAPLCLGSECWKPLEGPTHIKFFFIYLTLQF